MLKGSWPHLILLALSFVTVEMPIPVCNSAKIALVSRLAKWCASYTHTPLFPPYGRDTLNILNSLIYILSLWKAKFENELNIIKLGHLSKEFQYSEFTVQKMTK